MILFTIILCCIYSVFILYLYAGTFRNSTSPDKPIYKVKGFSIVVPFRNEAEFLPGLLNSFAQLQFPRENFEILLVDDSSEDTSVQCCLDFKDSHYELNITLLRSDGRFASPKKSAIDTAVKKAKFPFILTTDADCIVPKKWLSVYKSYLSNSETCLVAGPVRLTKNNRMGFRQLFEQMDIISLQAATMGGFGHHNPFLSNGANLCFLKKSFLELKGYYGNEFIASGDDVFLLEKFKNAGLKTGYIKDLNAVVTTAGQKDLRSLVSQRIRWASKSTAYKSFFTRILSLVIFTTNLWFVLAIIPLALGSASIRLIFFLFLVKILMDFLLISRAIKFFRLPDLIIHYLWCAPVYPLFCSYIGICSLFSGYIWKGRRFKK